MGQFTSKSNLIHNKILKPKRILTLFTNPTLQIKYHACCTCVGWLDFEFSGFEKSNPMPPPAACRSENHRSSSPLSSIRLLAPNIFYAANPTKLFFISPDLNPMKASKETAKGSCRNASKKTPTNLNLRWLLTTSSIISFFLSFKRLRQQQRVKIDSCQDEETELDQLIQTRVFLDLAE